MKTLIYAKRNFKELISDPISSIFTIELPIFLLIFMVTLNKKLDVNDAFKIENFLPSTIIFSFTFLTMFSGMLIAKDRSSSFLSRMFVSPLKPYEYILEYIIPLLVMAFIQITILYLIGFVIGITVTIDVLMTIPFLFLMALLFVGLGLLLGSVLKDQQVGPVASILIQIVAFLSGMWFSLDLVGGAFRQIGNILPFAHAVDPLRYVLSGNYNQIITPLIVISLYTISILLSAILLFKKNMKNN